MKYSVSFYILFFIACVLFSAYRHFPGQAAADQVEQFLASSVPGLTATVAPLTLGFPLGVKSSSIQTTLENHPFVRVDEASAQFRLKTLFSDRRQIAYSGRIFGGDVTGIATLSGKDRSGSENGAQGVLTESRFDGISLNGVALNAFVSSGVTMTGQLSGSLTADVSRGRIKGQGEMTSSGLTVEWENPLFSISSVSFSDSVLRFDMPTPDTIQITTFELKGNQVNLQFSGTILPMVPVEKSKLQLTAEIIFHPGFLVDTEIPIDMVPGGGARPIRFNITGTIQNPIFQAGAQAG
ncbi:MAG: type II secretion system protein GspN [Desulfobacterales bacterium]|nr:MAG: type II secretion system protein GspN [Desulfobacterales bacterium]